ncbi:Mov34/MPN/PAD-1 family protein [Paenibacillus sp. 1P07SE]|uniref:Mov34/MPN/PAD-1 family protein n=1 Tax=Paenibacillus sp. 1P07SE TaxID=3132209 RepID=UPI0039A4E819
MKAAEFPDEICRITAAAVQQMTACALSAYPLEACGVLLSGTSSRIESAVPIRNGSRHPERSFSFDPEQWIPIYYAAQKNQQIVVGFFHSHPHGSPEPSAADYAGLPPAFAGVYCIVSLEDESPRVHAYRGISGRLSPLVLAQIGI